MSSIDKVHKKGQKIKVAKIENVRTIAKKQQKKKQQQKVVGKGGE